MVFEKMAGATGRFNVFRTRPGTGDLITTVRTTAPGWFPAKTPGAAALAKH